MNEVEMPMRPDSEYLFVEVAAQRCVQLMRGARPKIETKARKYTTLAIREVDAGEVPWEISEEESPDLVATGMQEEVEEEASED